MENIYEIDQDDWVDINNCIYYNSKYKQLRLYHCYGKYRQYSVKTWCNNVELNNIDKAFKKLKRYIGGEKKYLDKMHGITHNLDGITL